MNLANPINFDALMEPVAARLLSEPNKRLSKPPKDVRYGTHGSMSVNLETGQFYDHEAKAGGGVIDLVKHMLGCDRGGAIAWLRGEGLLPERPTRSHIPPEPEEPRQKFVCAYDYVDEDGKLLHQTVRYADPKKFLQRRPNPEKFGEWIWKLNDVRRVLYRLPEVIAAKDNAQTIFLVEGEKDADNLHSRGFAATTNPMGAKYWIAEFSEMLRGADIVVMGDNDEAGRPHVAKVIGCLHGVAKRLRVLDLAEVWPECPEGGDISDWLEAGGTGDKLAALVESLPDWEPVDGWPKMDKAALHGIAGKVVTTIEPHSEADPNALLIQFLVAAGNAIGRAPFYRVEGDYHYTKLNVVLVGATGDGRKGTSLGRILQVMELGDKEWTQYRVQSGLVSGEGLIHHVRDPLSKIKDGAMVEVDNGVSDKRLLIDAQEFAGTLAVIEKPGNTLSAVIRDAWGHKVLQTLGKVSPDKATGSHISIIAHITESELRRKLTRTELGNGFANRFLFAKVRRSKQLPHGGHLNEADLVRLGEQVKTAIEKANKIGRVTMTDAAAAAWAIAYRDLGAGREGMLGEVIARAAPQVIRIALIYAVLDNSTVIDLPHLRAGLAVWEFCEESAIQIFGDSLGDPVADTILAALKAVGSAGKSRTEISGLFGRHQTSEQIREALNLLLKYRKARSESVERDGPGRSTEVWFAVAGGR
jgi:hypothetical protein